MKKTLILLCSAAAIFLISSCSKEGDTIINNYGSSDDVSAPKRTMFKEYGLTDSSQSLRFSYHNNEIGKLNLFTSFMSGVPLNKLVILYNSSNLPEGYQTFLLPANTLDQQGTFKLDEKNRITEVIKREINGDTIGIVYLQYTNLEYQPVSISYYNKSNDRFSRYEYYTYDSKGNVKKVSSYQYNGTDPLFLEREIEAGGYDKIINPLNQLYYYLVLSFSDYGIGSSAPLYFSHYLPSNTREQTYLANGNKSYVYVNNSVFIANSDNNPIKMITQGNSSQEIYFKY